jgi:hypothetical protein
MDKMMAKLTRRAPLGCIDGKNSGLTHKNRVILLAHMLHIVIEQVERFCMAPGRQK